jgi:ABC-2 type transport system ATP-binding protein
MTEPPVIAVQGLSRRYGDLEAVRGVSFDVARGEVFGFLGPNGAGKTTTISMLCTLLRPTGGTALVNGCDVVREATAVRRSIGIVFQDPTLDEQLTAEQNLRFHALAYGMSRADFAARAEELLHLVELWERRRDRVRTFSGGMKRRLELVRGLLHRPRVLFLDEPTLGLDPQTRRLIWEHVLALRQREGLTIFLTTHYMDEAEVSDRIAVIDHGGIIALDTPERLKDGLGGDVVTLKAEDNGRAAQELTARYGLAPRAEDGALTFRIERGDEWLPQFVREFPLRLTSIGVRRPTLDDVFLSLTGRAIRGDDEGDDVLRRWQRTRRRGRRR